FFFNVQGLEKSARGQHAESLIIERIQSLHQAARIDIAPESVKAGQQSAVIRKAIQGDAIKHQIIFARSGWFEGRMGQAEKAGPAGIRPWHMPHLGGKTDERRDGSIGRTFQLREHRPEAWPTSWRRIDMRTPSKALHGVMVTRGSDNGA